MSAISTSNPAVEGQQQFDEVYCILNALFGAIRARELDLEFAVRRADQIPGA